MARRLRRSADQWKALIDQYQSCDVSAAEFCRREALSYQSFMGWRKRLSSAPEQQSTFIELTRPDVSAVEPMVGHTVLIELDLGSGIQLRISRQG